MKRKRPPRRDLLELPMDLVPPTYEEVAASARSCPMLATLVGLREWLGPDGRRYDRNRSISFSDSHSAARLFGLELFADPGARDDAPLCADIEPRVALACAVGFECGAIEEIGDRIVPRSDWDDDGDVVKASTALSALIEIGPVRTSLQHLDAFVDVRDWVLDSSFVHWLATLLPPGRTQRVSHFVDWTSGEWRQQFGRDVSGEPGDADLWAANGTCYLVDALTWAGAIDWHGRELLTFELDEPLRFWGGGEISLTPLGRHVLPDHLEAAGLTLRDPEPVDPARRSARGLLGDVLLCRCVEERSKLVDAWRRDLGDDVRAKLVVDVLNETDAVHYRLAAFDALERIGPDAAAPHVRQLLDSPNAESAAEFLVRHGLADADQLRPFVGYGPLLDLFVSAAGRPDVFARMFVRLLEGCEAPDLLLEVLALHETHAATIVLTAAARHVDDPRYAPMIQVAEQYHHAVMFDAERWDDVV